MKKRVFKPNPLQTLLAWLAPVSASVVVIAMLMIGLAQADTSSRAEGVRLLEESITRATLHSYAVNGRFPQSLAYLEAHFNLYIDRTRFLVHYEVFASNMMPSIMVFPLER